MDIVEIALLNYQFKFRALTWREEVGMKFDPKDDRMRVILTHALCEVSGLPVKSIDEARRVLAPLPPPVVYRVFVIYKGSLPPPRLFNTVGLYKAPEPNRLAVQFERVEEEREAVMDRVEAEMEAKFGRKEIQEARDLERQMFENSKGR